MTEHEALEEIREALTAEKVAARRTRKASRALMEINKAEGRYEESNQAYKFMSMAGLRHAQVEKDHAVGTEMLHEYWPDHAVPDLSGGVISTRSGHR